MIECTKNNLLNKKHRVFKFKRCFSWLILIVFLVNTIAYFKIFVCDKIVNISNQIAKSYALDSINSSILISVDEQIKYNDFIDIEKNNVGDVVFMQANAYKSNLISRQIVKNTKLILEGKISKGLPFNSFVFTGIDILAGYGKKIRIKTLSIINCNCDFVSEFTSVGINQTLHSIYTEISVEIKVNFGLSGNKSIVKSKVLLCEGVIVGKVPEFYLGDWLFEGKSLTNN